MTCWLTRIALAFVFFVSFNPIAKAEEKARQQTDFPLPRTIEYRWMTLDQWKLFHEADLKRAKAGPIDLLFFGDSITECWDSRGSAVWKKQFASLNGANFGVGGDTTQNLLWRITKGGAMQGLSPKVVVLMIGTNNIGLHRDKPQDVARGVRANIEAIHAISPGSRIILHPIFPRGANPDDSMRKDVVSTNRLLEPFGALEYVTWVPVWDVFLDRKGNLPKAIMPDYLHPTEKGYQIWAKEIKPTIRRLMKTSR